MQQRHVLELAIPPGSQDGQRFTFSGQGDCLPGQVAGDIVCQLQMEEHERFRRHGDELFCRCSLSLEEALCGGKVSMDYLDGAKLLMKTSPGVVVAPGSFQRARGKGMPVFGKGIRSDSANLAGAASSRGDLYVQFEVLFPSSLDKELATRLAAALLSARTGGSEAAPEASTGGTGLLQAASRALRKFFKRRLQKEVASDRDCRAEENDVVVLEAIAAATGAGHWRETGDSVPRSRL